MTYIILKEGVYMQGVYGPIEDSELAIARTIELADADSDDYHHWSVYYLEWEGLGSMIYETKKGESR